MAATLAILFVAQSQSACAGKLVTISDADRGKTIEPSTGDTLVISIDANPSTGYSWRIGKNDAAILKFVEQFIFPPKTSMPGAPSRQMLKFKAIAAGSDAVELEYVRPWEKGVAPAKTFPFTVEVK